MTRRIPWVALSFFLAMSLPGQAQDLQGAFQRLEALKTSDPDLYALIRVLSRKPDIEGGFDYAFDAGQLDCDEAYDGGFDDCSLDIHIEATSHAGSEDDRDARLEFECEMSVTTTDADGYRSYESASGDSTISLWGSGTRRDTITLEVSFYGMTPITRVSVDSLDCELTDID